MNAEGAYATRLMEPRDALAGFRCGVHALDDFFARHALTNDAAGIGRVFVLRRAPEDEGTLPGVLGFYTLSMGSAEPAPLETVLGRKLPRYAMPVALVGRLAVDLRAQGRGLGGKLLVDGLRRVLEASTVVGCTGVIVDPKDERAEPFYAGYGFVSMESPDRSRRTYLPLQTVRVAFGF